HHALVFLQTYFEKRLGAFYACIVDQDVDAAPAAQHRVHHCSHAGFAADIHGDWFDIERGCLQPRRRLVRSRGTRVGYCDTRATRGNRARRRLANPTGSAGYDRNFLFAVHEPPRRWRIKLPCALRRWGVYRSSLTNYCTVFHAFRDSARPPALLDISQTGVRGSDGILVWGP